MSRGHEARVAQRTAARAATGCRSPWSDNHTHLDMARDGESPPDIAAGASPRRAPVGVDRFVQVGCDLDGARSTARSSSSTPSWLAGSRCTRTRHRDWPQPGILDEALEEIEPLAGSPDRRGVGETGLDYYPHRQRSARRRPNRRRSARTSRWPSGSAKRCRSTTGTRTTTCCGSSRTQGAPDARCSIASPGTPRWREFCARQGWYMSLRRYGDVQERRSTARARCGRTGRTAPGRDRRAVPDTGAVPGRAATRRTSCRSPCARWRASSAWTCRHSRQRCRTTANGSTGPGDTAA